MSTVSRGKEGEKAPSSARAKETDRRHKSIENKREEQARLADEEAACSAAEAFLYRRCSANLSSTHQVSQACGRTSYREAQEEL